MKLYILGVAALAAFAGPAKTLAETPASADVWIGVEAGDNGFLLDTDTGQLWMTGSCLKQMSPATATGETWVSTTRELVSVGRMRAVLEQTVTLDLLPGQPSIVVDNAFRGGAQTVSDVAQVSCNGGACARFAQAPAC